MSNDEGMTIFEKIIRREIPAKIVYEDDEVIAFHDVDPKAPVHVLIVPKRIIPRLAEATEAEKDARKQLGIAKLNYAKSWVKAFYDYSERHGGQMPSELNQAVEFFPSELANSKEPTDWEIVYQGSLKEILDRSAYKPEQIIVLREREAMINVDGTRSKTYGFADGHSEIRREPVEGFEQWENGKIIGKQ